MPIKTNRIRSFFAFQALVFAVAFPSALPTFGQGINPPSPTADNTRVKSRQTPEQRAAEKQRALDLQNEIAQKRQKTFGTLPPDDSSEVGQKYQAAFDRFREATIGLNQVQMSFHLEKQFSSTFREKINNDWQLAIGQGYSAKANWLRIAGETFASDPEKYIAIGQSLCEMMVFDVELDRVDGWLEAAKAIVDSKKFETVEILRSAGLIAYANSDFDFANTCLTRALALQEKKSPDANFGSEIEGTRAKWQRELEFRQREAEKGDNPRVEFLTTKGKIVMELYEDSAPETVKSFIYLVERGFFSRKTFFRVEKHLCVQTGCEKGDGTGDAGYAIANESQLPNHRDHFRGTMALALGTDANGQIQNETGSSQFYFSFQPQSHLDGKFTVFGRIVEGLETLSTFRVMNLANAEERKEGKQPDVILSATVLRKRDTVYKPQIIIGKLPK